MIIFDSIPIIALTAQFGAAVYLLILIHRLEKRRGESQ
jgi:hypothetical protein